MKADNNKKKTIRSLFSRDLTLEEKQNVIHLQSVEKEMQKQWDESDKDLMNPAVKQRIWNRIQHKCNEENKTLVHAERWYTIAAAAAILLIVGGIWFTSNQESLSTDKFINIVALENKTFTLPDSSKVWMEAGSSIRYAENFHKSRKVWLRGNSLFEVYKHEGSTFQVHFNKAFIEVKGTCFLIKQYSAKRNEITLFRGKIDFNVESTGQRTTVEPLQKIIYDSSTAKTSIKNINYMNWENGKYTFTDIPLPKLIQTINKMYGSNITLAGNITHDSEFTGSIRYDESLEDIIGKICFSMNLQKQKQNNQIILRK